MAVLPPIPPASNVYWAELEFGGPYLKSFPVVASDKTKGLTQDDLDYGERKAHYQLYGLFRQYYSKEILESWISLAIPQQVRDWADEIAAAHALALAAAGGRIERKDNYREWAEAVLKEVRSFLSSGGILLDIDHNVIQGLKTPTQSAAGIRGPRVSTQETPRVFSEGILKWLVERDAIVQRSYTTEEEFMESTYGI